MYLVSTQHIQGALVVGDDDVGSLCLQMLPAAHIEPKTQEVLHVTNQDADNPDRGEEKKKVIYWVSIGYQSHSHVSWACRLHIINQNSTWWGGRWYVW